MPTPPLHLHEIGGWTLIIAIVNVTLSAACIDAVTHRRYGWAIVMIALYTINGCNLVGLLHLWNTLYKE